MKKLVAGLTMIAFAGVTFAAAHGGAPKDDKKMEEMKAACMKADPKMDDKMKMECKKMMEEKKK